MQADNEEKEDEEEEEEAKTRREEADEEEVVCERATQSQLEGRGLSSVTRPLCSCCPSILEFGITG